MSAIKYIISQTFRFLSFRQLEISNKHDLNLLMASGIVFAWIAGVGRYWDHPSALTWQYAGLGSVAYIFALSLFIWLIVLPMKPERWNYKSVLTFVGLTSPLAWLYAVPVERFTSMDTAIGLNVWFLAIVAFWRVALYAVFLRKFAKLPSGAVLLVMILPLTAIIFALAALNLEHAVFEIMAGLESERREGQELIHDNVFAFIIKLGIISTFLFPIFSIIYAGACLANLIEFLRARK